MDNVKRMRLDFPCLQTTVFIEDTVSIAKNLYIPSDLESVCIVVHLEKKRLQDNQCLWFATIIFIMGVSKNQRWLLTQQSSINKLFYHSRLRSSLDDVLPQKMNYQWCER